MKNSISKFLIVLVLFSLNSYANDYLSFDQDLSIQTSGLNKFVVDVGAGSLVVRGDNVDKITVAAKIYSKKYDSIEDLQDAFESEMILTLEGKGSVATLKASNKKRIFSFSNSEIAIDINIIVPKTMNIEIDDGSGNMEVSDIDGWVEIDDGSGSLVVRNLGNQLKIDDGSGNMKISNIAGDVFIDDGSGNTIIDDVRGSITIEDGSGQIEVTKVTGDFTVNDGSGSIEIKELSGEFHLVDDGSGSIIVNGKKWNRDD